MEIFRKFLSSSIPKMELRIGQRDAIGALCCAAIACYAYPLFDMSRAWEFMVLWDDDLNFFTATVYRSLAPSHLWQMITLTWINVYEPLAWLLKALVYAAVGLDARAYRIVTLAFHLAAAWVLAHVASTVIIIAQTGISLGRRTASPPRQSLPIPSSDQFFNGCVLATLALFVIHPLNVEVVFWASAQPYALCALFSTASLYLHCRALMRRVACEQFHSPRAARGASPETELSPSELEKVVALVTPSLSDVDTRWSIGLFIMAALSKSVCVLFPLAAVLVDLLLVLPVAAAFQSRYGSYPPLRQLLPSVAKYVLAYLPFIVSVVALVIRTVTANTQGSHEDADVLTLTTAERMVKTVMAPALAMRHLLWPANLRPHYNLHDDELRLLTNSDCLLSAMALVMAVGVLALQRGEYRFAVRLAAVYYCAMLLPTCGLVQHGLVSLTADRYAYFSTMVLVPIAGFKLTHWLSLDTSAIHQDGTSPTASATGSPVKQAPSVSQRHALLARLLYTATIAALLSISQRQIELWESPLKLYTGSVARDPTDWRMLDSLWQLRLNNLGGCGEDFALCKNEINLAYYYAPSKSLKAKLYRYMALYVLGHEDEVCGHYRSLLAERPGHATVLNNVGFCALRDGDVDAARLHFKAAQATPTLRDADHEKIADNFFRTEELASKMAKTKDEVPFEALLLW